MLTYLVATVETLGKEGTGHTVFAAWIASLSLRIFQEVEKHSHEKLLQFKPSFLDDPWSNSTTYQILHLDELILQISDFYDRILPLLENFFNTLFSPFISDFKIDAPVPGTVFDPNKQECDFRVRARDPSLEGRIERLRMPGISFE